MFPHQHRPAIRLRDYRREAAIGLALGVTLAAGAKYFAAALLILWLMAGGR